MYAKDLHLKRLIVDDVAAQANRDVMAEHTCAGGAGATSVGVVVVVGMTARSPDLSSHLIARSPNTI